VVALADSELRRGQPSWDDALDLLDADAKPVHVARFGVQLDAKGVLAESPDADRCVSYITKYLTKQAADCHTPDTDRQRAHLEPLWIQLRRTSAPNAAQTGCSAARNRRPDVPHGSQLDARRVPTGSAVRSRRAGAGTQGPREAQEAPE
jgi:hypothetical protein